jgi:hypothetical protein
MMMRPTLLRPFDFINRRCRLPHIRVVLQRRTKPPWVARYGGAAATARARRQVVSLSIFYTPKDLC